MSSKDTALHWKVPVQQNVPFLAVCTGVHPHPYPSHNLSVPLDIMEAVVPMESSQCTCAVRISTGSGAAFTWRCCRWERLQGGCVEANSNESIHWCWPAGGYYLWVGIWALAKTWGRQMLTEMVGASMDVPVSDRTRIFGGAELGCISKHQTQDSLISKFSWKDFCRTDFDQWVRQVRGVETSQNRLFVLAQVKVPYC